MSAESSKRDLLREAVRGLAAAAPAGTCLAEEELVLFYRAEMAEERMESIRDHLVSCPACLALAREAREFLDLRAADPLAKVEPTSIAGIDCHPAVPLRGRKRWRTVARVAAALVVVAGAGWALRSFVSVPGPFDGNPWRDLAIARPEYGELEFRGEAPPRLAGSSAPSFIEAMRPYAQGDDPAAEAALARYLEAHPGDLEALFYRGASLLLLGRLEEAIESLGAARQSGEGWIRDQAAWFLAVAHLKGGHADAAAATLDSLLAGGRFRQDEARKLRDEIRRAAGR